MAVTARTALVPLFLVSLAAVGYETALTRYFAVAKWSEYGYWVISIVMVGFAFSGVVLALFRDSFARRGAALLAVLPALLVATAAIGFHLTAANPFNPLQLQNPATFEQQLWNIAGYYACLLPFFFLAGVFVSLSFVLNADRIGQVYGYDLTGAGAGAALVLAAMFVVHAFFLVPLLLVPLAASAWFVAGPWRRVGIAAAGVALLGAEALLLLDNQAEFNDFKAIYAPLHTPDARVLATVLSPRGDYALLDDFTERVDTDISNNAGMLGLPGPPQTFGLYRDGNRIAALPKPGELDVGYAAASLDALPYRMIPHANVLLAGASGGYRVAEILALGAAHIRTLEPEPVLLRSLERGLGPSPAWRADSRVSLSGEGPVAAVRDGGSYDIIDLSADFLDAAEANTTAFTVQAITDDLRALTPGGIVSIPVSIRDFPVYAVRMLGTAREALLAAGITDPAAHTIVYRSAWSARILLSNQPWDTARIATLRKFCDERSFDVSWYPGMDAVAARGGIYNDLPAVSFASGEITSDGPDDAIADEARAVLANAATPSQSAFNLTPITLDRPFFYAVLRLDQLDTILQRLEILPQAEIGALVNLAVLAQAAVIAIVVLLVPLVAPRRLRLPEIGLVRPIVYFPALGLGFLFIEIFMIEKASLWLNDRTSGFALVLTGILVFSGLGSMTADRLELSHASQRRVLSLACLVVIAWCAACLAVLQPAILASLDLPWTVRAALVLAVLAPVSLALGLPFPLGLTRTGSGGLLPWAWGLNGAFSVVATPLANLIAREAGFSRVLLSAAVLYVIALMTFPAARKSRAWQQLSARSHVAE
jgi:MFS family permease